MKNNNFTILFIAFSFIFVFLTASIYISNNQGGSQVAQVRKSSISQPQSQQQNQSYNWRILRSGNDIFARLPAESLPAVESFCQDLSGILPPGSNILKIGAFEGLDGVYQCNDGSGPCGDGTRSGCRSSGCCGGCINGLYPPGISDPAQLPQVVFIPDSVMQALRDTFNQ